MNPQFAFPPPAPVVRRPPPPTRAVPTPGSGSGLGAGSTLRNGNNGGGGARESNALRASVLDAALELGLVGGGGVGGWMFDNRVLEEGEEVGFFRCFSFVFFSCSVSSVWVGSVCGIWWMEAVGFYFFGGWCFVGWYFVVHISGGTLGRLPPLCTDGRPRVKQPC